jgi:GLPGLI family protein
MKKYFFLLFTFLAPVSLFAQTYELQYRVVQEISGADIQLSYKGSIMINDRFYLYVLQPTKDLLKNEIRKQLDDESTVVFYPNPDTIPRMVYRSFDSSVTRYKISNSQDDIAFYVQSYSPLRMNLKPTNERRLINGFSCIKAVLYHPVYTNTTVAEVWYCPDIPIKTGPAELDGIPGLTVEAINFQTKEQFTLLTVQTYNKDYSFDFWHPEFNGVSFQKIGK